MKERIIIDGLLEGNFDNCLDDRINDTIDQSVKGFAFTAVNMSDHFKINIQVEIYDKWELDYNPTGEEIKETLKAVVKNHLASLGFDRDQFFVSC